MQRVLRQGHGTGGHLDRDPRGRGRRRLIAPGVIRRLIAQFAGQHSPGRKPRELTAITGREREVLRLVGLGMSNAEIATALYITAGTAKTHVARLLAKLDATDRSCFRSAVDRI
jgi:DNA-binding NarL/FixJ family response regulator